MIIKYKSISIKDKIHQLISELWSLIWKLVSAQYIKNELIESDKKVIKYDEEIPQSHTAHPPMAPWWRATEHL